MCLRMKLTRCNLYPGDAIRLLLIVPVQLMVSVTPCCNSEQKDRENGLCRISRLSKTTWEFHIRRKGLTIA